MYQDSLVKELLRQIDINDPTPNQLALAKNLFLQIGIRIDCELTFDPRLSDDEIKCLFFIAHGYSTRRIATAMDKKFSTVASYQKEIKRKLKCNTVAQAIFRGIKFGYLPFEKLGNKETPTNGVR